MIAKRTVIIESERTTKNSQPKTRTTKNLDKLITQREFREQTPTLSKNTPGTEKTTKNIWQKTIFTNIIDNNGHLSIKAFMNFIEHICCGPRNKVELNAGNHQKFTKRRIQIASEPIRVFKTNSSIKNA